MPSSSTQESAECCRWRRSTRATYDEHFAVNVKGQFFTLQKLLPLIGPGGSIIFTTSVGSHIGAPNWSVYTATKGALMAMVRALAV